MLNKDANANPKRVQQMVKLLSDKQRGVDDAKRATGHKDVSIHQLSQVWLQVSCACCITVSTAHSSCLVEQV